MKFRNASSRLAFTLVELLVVIAIIGILAGLTLPVLLGVVNNMNRSGIKLEIDSIADAVEKYRDKYGDYPPDGSDWNVMKRHLQKAFPQILLSELDLLDPSAGDTLATTSNQYNFTGTGSGPCIRNSSDTLVTTANGFAANELRVMDPAEALVFFLGGFSSDPKKPFTGRGGPFLEVLNGAVSYSPKRYQYNVSRENPLFEFNSGRLTININGTLTASNDEEKFFGNTSVPTNTENDLLPVYLSKIGDVDTTCPYVYFDSRTYVSNKPLGGRPNPYFNFYQRTPIAGAFASDVSLFGAIYPFYSDQPNTSNKSLPGVIPANRALYVKFLAYQFMEPQKFQLVGPGLDGKYGGRLVADVRGASDQGLSLQQTMFRFPSGLSLDESYKSFRPAPELNQDPIAVPSSVISRMTDDVANFSSQTLSTGAP